MIAKNENAHRLIEPHNFICFGIDFFVHLIIHFSKQRDPGIYFMNTHTNNAYFAI